MIRRLIHDADITGLELLAGALSVLAICLMWSLT